MKNINTLVIISLFIVLIGCAKKENNDSTNQEEIIVEGLQNIQMEQIDTVRIPITIKPDFTKEDSLFVTNIPKRFEDYIIDYDPISKKLL